MKKSKILKISYILVAVIILAGIYTYYKINKNQKEREIVCFDELAKKLDNGIEPQDIFDEDFQELQKLVEYSLVARTEMLEVASRLKVDEDQPLKSSDLFVLKSGTEDYLEIRDDLFAIANAYECGLDVRDKTLKAYNIDKNTHLKGIMLSLGAALTLYDNYFLGIVLFEEDDRLRKVINDPDMGFGLVANRLKEMTLNSNSI